MSRRQTAIQVRRSRPSYGLSLPRFHVPKLPAWAHKRYLKVPVWGWGLGGVGLLALVVAGRRQAVEGVVVVSATLEHLIGGAWDWGKDEQFKAALPAHAQPYADLILENARANGVNPLLIYAIGENETRWGSTHDYKQQTGDWTARTGHWVTSPPANTRTVQTLEDLPPGWTVPKSSTGEPMPGPYQIPDDGLGWGRGIMQLDFDNAQSFDWTDDRANVAAGVAHYLRDRGVVASRTGLTDDALDWATVAAYNTGAGNVAKNLAAGKSVDATTTGGNYSARALAAKDAVESKMTV